MNPTVQLIATIILVLFILACLWVAFFGKPEERRMGWVGVAFAAFAIFVNAAIKVEDALFINPF